MALLIVLTGVSVAAGTNRHTDVQTHVIASRRLDARLKTLRHRRHRLEVLIHSIRARIESSSPASSGLLDSGGAETTVAHAKIGGARVVEKIQRWSHRLHRRIRLLMRRRHQLDTWLTTIGIFRRCPVPIATSMADNFGVMVRLPKVPVHLHQGIDIMAQTGAPILAPFDGTAQSGAGVLGGNTVVVEGEFGWVYNAHLSAFSAHSNGPVHAGDVIGYVGDTGDAVGSHDHFEYHPNQIPASWPAGPSGYSVIGSAIDPDLMLEAACS